MTIKEIELKLREAAKQLGKETAEQRAERMARIFKRIEEESKITGQSLEE